MARKLGQHDVALEPWHLVLAGSFTRVVFYTRTKTVTARWPSGTKGGAEFVIPAMK